MDLLRALAEHGYASLKMAGGSMSPTLSAGDSVVVRRGRARLGDVVVIDARGEWLVHRLVAQLPGRRWVHAGDHAGALPGVCHDDEVVACAELPRKRPRRLQRLRFLALAVARALLIVTALAGCKQKPTAPPVPMVVEVRVTDRTPADLPQPEVAALQKAAARVIGASGMPVVDGGAAAPFKLRVEVRLEGAEDADSKKGALRAFVMARLTPVGAPPGALSFEEGAVAERIYDLAELGDKTAAFRAHAVRAVEDVVRSVGARAKLARGSSAELVAALNGSDEDLREEAVRIAAERKEKQAVPPLLAMLKSEDRAVRDRAIGALAAIGDPRAVKPLTEVARFREYSELPKVLDAISAIGGDEARAYLEFVASGHEHPDMRALAKTALEHLDRRAQKK
jgi:hypothetical protein